eukprot:3525525-Rhodomonas_salina.1
MGVRERRNHTVMVTQDDHHDGDRHAEGARDRHVGCAFALEMGMKRSASRLRISLSTAAINGSSSAINIAAQLPQMATSLP